MKICAICAASSSTWLILLILKLLNFQIDTTIIGVLVGGSTVGIMYKLEEYFKKNNLRHFWIIRVSEICTGFFIAYSLAKWDQVYILPALLLFSFTLVTIIMLSILQKKKTTKNDKESTKQQKKNKNAKEKKKEDAIKKLEKSLEDCC